MDATTALRRAAGWVYDNNRDWAALQDPCAGRTEREAAGGRILGRGFELAASLVPLGLGAKSLLGKAALADGVLTEAADETLELATESGPLAGTRYTPKVMKDMQADIYHGFPKIIDDLAGEYGTTSEITGGDSIPRTRLSLPGNINGVPGEYEWLINPDGTINHRYFRH